MTQKIHNAQLEVWEWKEALYKELQDVPRANWAEYLYNLAKEPIKYLEKLKAEKEIHSK